MRLNTKLNITLGLLMMVSSSLAQALGFGEIKLNSALNQPLKAEITLINVRDLTEREIVVGLASTAEFERAGVDRAYFLSDFKFSVDLDSKKGPIISITSKEPVREPFLNFLIFAQWPSGKLLREYTLLVDLPIFSGAQSAPVRVVTKESSNIVPPSEKQVVATPKVKSPNASGDSAVESSSFESDVYGPVSSNDTLWTIAVKVRPSTSYSVQQTMLAIQRLNPKAFINNNINLLKRGQVLRIPDGDQIQELSAREAIKEVAGQNTTWNSDATSEESGDQAQLEGSKKYTETKTETTEVEGRVKLTTAGSSNNSGVAQGADEGESTDAIVEKALDVTQEELDAVSREKDELQSKLSALDSQIDTMEKLVEVSNEELAALELAASRTNESNSEESNSVTDSEVETEVTPETPATEVVPVTAEAIKPAVPVQKPKPAKSIMDLVMENIIYISAGAGALVLIVAIFIFMRKRNSGFDDGFDDDEFEDLSSFDSTNLDNGLDGYEGNDDLNSLDDTTQVLAENNDLEPEEEISAEAETEDVVGECDIHLAYGQFEQAEEKLLRALEKEPANASVRLKLLEVYAALADASAFDNHYSKLLSMNNAEVTAKASSLRESVIDISAYDASKFDTSDFEALISVGTGSHSESSASENIDLSNDTLDFGDDEIVIAKNNKLDELSLDSVDVLLEDDEEETLIGAVATQDDYVDADDFSLALDDEDETLVDSSKSKTENQSLQLDADDDLGVDSDLGDFDLGDLDLDLGEGELSLSGLDDDLDDVEFDLGDDEESSESEFSVSDQESDELSSEFSENLVADSAIIGGLDDIDFSGEDMDSAELDLSEDDAELALDSDEDEFDLSLGDDLELNLDENAESEGGLSKAFEDLGEFGDLDLADDPMMEESNLSDDEITLDVNPEKVASTSSNSQEEGDFDVTFNLDDGLNLDELDQELDELSSVDASLDDEADLSLEDEDALDLSVSEDFEIASDLMEEPVVDLDEEMTLSEVNELDLPAQPDSEELVEKSVEGGLNVSRPSSALHDLQAEAANELDAGISDLAHSSEFDADSDFEIPDFDPASDDDSNLDFLSDNDETATKLDLARAYIDMGDADGARDILDEILEEGNDGQRKDAEVLLKKLA